MSHPGEHTALDRIVAGLEEFADHIAVMRDEEAQILSPGNTQDPHLVRARDAYTQATDVLHTRINRQPLLDQQGRPVFAEQPVPACRVREDIVDGAVWPLGSFETNLRCLNNTNIDDVDKVYQTTLAFLNQRLIVAKLLGGLFSLVLVGATVRMMVVTHRIGQIALLAGLVLSAGYSMVVVRDLQQLIDRHQAFGLMVKDAYDSIYRVNHLRRYATLASSAESNWLIAKTFGDESGAKRWEVSWHSNVTDVQKDIAALQQNRTWAEEDRPLTDIADHWQAYVAVDGHIRAIAQRDGTSSNVQDATKLSISDSNHAFADLGSALDRLNAVDRTYLARTDQHTALLVARDIRLSWLLIPLAGLAATLGILRWLKDF